MNIEQKYKYFFGSFTLGSFQVFQESDLVIIWFFNLIGAALAAVLMDWIKILLNEKVKPLIIRFWGFLLKKLKNAKTIIENYIKNGL